MRVHVQAEHLLVGLRKFNHCVVLSDLCCAPAAALLKSDPVALWNTYCLD